MAYKTPIPTDLEYAPCGTTPFWQVQTVGPGSYKLWVFGRKPSLIFNIFSHRGKRFLKRYYYSADFIACIDEVTHGPNFNHVWRLPFRAIGTQVWLVYTDSCDPHFATFTSPPIPYVYISCTGISTFATAGASNPGFFTMAGNGVVNVPDFVDGDPALYNGGNGTFSADQAGTWSITIAGNMKPTSLSLPWTGTFHVRNFTTGQNLSSQAITLADPNVSVGAQGAWTGILNAPNSLGGWFQPTSPPSLQFGSFEQPFGYIKRRL